MDKMRHDAVAEVQEAYRLSAISDPARAERLIELKLNTHPYLKREDIFTGEFDAQIAQDLAQEHVRGDAFLDWLLAGDPQTPAQMPVSIARHLLTDSQREELIRGFASLGMRATGGVPPTEAQLAGDAARQWDGKPVRMTFVERLQLAADLLANDRRRESIEYLRSQVRHGEPLCARTAARALCRSGDPLGIQAVLDLANTAASSGEKAVLLSDLDAARIAVEGMQKGDDKAVSDQTREEYRAALRSAKEQILPLVTHEESILRMAALNLLDWNDPQDRLLLMERFDQETDWHVRMGIVASIPLHPDRANEVSAFVKQRAVTSDPAGRRLLVSPLARLAQTDEEARSLLENLALHDQDAEIRSEAKSRLDRLDDDSREAMRRRREEKKREHSGNR